MRQRQVRTDLAAELAALPLITTTAKTTSSTTEAGYTNARPVEHSYTGNFLPISTPAIAVDYHGIDAKFYASNGNVNSFASGIQTQVYAFEATAGFLTPTAATIGRLVPMYGQARNDSPGTVDEARLLQVWAQNVGTGQIKSVTGFIMYNPSNTGGGAPPQYVYGINMPDLTAGTVDNYAIKTGLGKVSFGDAVSMTSTGPVPAFTAITTYAGFWAAQFIGPDYGITIATSANTGRTLDVNKNGTGSGSAVVVTNKGTGSTMLLRNSTTTLVDFRANGSLSWTLPATDTPASNGMITMELVSNTSLVIKVKGSDGVVRSATLTLS